MLSFHAKVVHFTFNVVMLFQNFDVDLKKKKYLWKLLLVKMKDSKQKFTKKLFEDVWQGSIYASGASFVSACPPKKYCDYRKS